MILLKNKQLGTKILNNYKNQLTFSKIRERMEKGECIEPEEIKETKEPLFSTEPPEPEVLFDILAENSEGNDDYFFLFSYWHL